MAEGDAHHNDAALAAQLVQGGTGQQRLLPEDFEESAHFGSMSAPAKVEVYTRRLLNQLTSERDRLLDDKKTLETECARLRVSERELISLKSCLVRDRWETAIAIIAMAVGGGLIGRGDALMWLGWSLVGVCGVWQVGKTLWITLVDWYSSER